MAAPKEPTTRQQVQPQPEVSRATEAIAKIHCDKCGAENRPEAVFCRSCGNKLPSFAGHAEKLVTKRSYLIGVCIILASAYSQYLIRGLGLISGMFVVYGIPLLTVSILCGSAIVRRALNRTSSALKFGLGFFGAFTLLGTFAAAAVFIIILALDPSAINLLNRPNPVLTVSPELAWIMVGVSLLFVGPVEEYLFRGFVYGGLLSLFKERHWLSLAFISSILFAAAHLYYAVVYGIASLVLFTDLVFFGMAMAATYYLSGGNLLIPAIVHGTYDAAAFIGVATSPDVGIFLRISMILIGLVVAIALFIQRMLKRRTSYLQSY